MNEKTGKLHSFLRNSEFFEQDLPKIRALLKEGADPNAQDGKSGDMALHLACDSESDPTKVVEILLRAGANVHARNGRGQTSLHNAITHPLIVYALFAAGAGLNVKDNTGLTPLHYAVVFGPISSIQLMLTHGVQLETTSKGSETPLDYALSQNSSTIDVLLEAGASVWARGEIGDRPAEHFLIYVKEWKAKLHTGPPPTTPEQVMHLVSVMEVENNQAIFEPLVRAKQLLDGMPHTPEINALYEMVLGMTRPSTPPQSLQEMRKAAPLQKGVGL